jgi:hypothetical protein
MNKVRTAVLAGAAAVALILPTASQAAPRRPSGTPAADVYTALAVSVLSEPHPVPAADGDVHLAYELLLMNPLPYPVTVERIEVLDTSHRDRVIDDFRGAALDAAMSSFIQVPGRVVAGGGVHKAVLDVVPAAGPRPRSLVHRLTVTIDPPIPELPNRFLGGRTTVSTERPVVLRAPVIGDRWVALIGCCAPQDHRVVMQTLNGSIYLAQRFAYDLTQLDAAGRLYNGPPDQVTSFVAYGKPVVGATSGVVVTAVDRFPDEIPFQEPQLLDPATIPGNHVVVDIGKGRYAMYSHLKPGSVRVAVGDRVRAGQPLGQVGNSGRTSGPHIHFQIMDSPSPLASEGLPFVIRSFDSEGSVPPLAQIDPTQPIPIGPELKGHYELVIPKVLQVLNFPRA